VGLSLVSTDKTIIIGSKQGPIIFFLLQFTYFNSGTVFMYAYKDLRKPARIKKYTSAILYHKMLKIYA